MEFSILCTTVVADPREANYLRTLIYDVTKVDKLEAPEAVFSLGHLNFGSGTDADWCQ